MDICKNYFEYSFRTACGFPKIILTGTKQDWVKLYHKTEKLLNTKVDPYFGKKWGNALLPILKRFVMAFDGKIDCLFWNSMIKRGATFGSGSWSWYSGWINVFFPIIRGKMNQYCVPYGISCDYVRKGLKKSGSGNDAQHYPKGLSSAPVEWQYHNVAFKLKFIGGFIGVQKNKENELSPMVGYIIGEKTTENEQVVKDVEKMMKDKNMKKLIPDK